MTQSLKAVMLSAFLFPGAGHFYLKRHMTGIFLSSITLLSLGYISVLMVGRAMGIVEKIQRGEIQFDIAVVVDLVAKQSAGQTGQFQQLAWIALLVAWGIGIADSYRLGRS